MNIRPKKILLFQGGGVSGVGRTSDDWYNNIHVHQMDTILNRLKKFGEADDYMYWLNSMQDAHSSIYEANKNRMDRPSKDERVERYQRAYSGDWNYYPYQDYNNPINRWQLPRGENGDNDDYNQYGIRKSFENGIFTYPGKRTSGDNPNSSFQPDGYYSGITDYRRLLGRKGDWDINSQQYKDWQKKLNELGYEMYLDETSDVGAGRDYYKLRRLNTQNQVSDPKQQNDKEKREGSLAGKEKEDLNKLSFWEKLSTGFKKVAPDLIDALRLAGNMYNNDRVYNESMKAIIPNLQQSYHTYRQVVGDEATKQAYYRRAVQGQTKAAQPFTSDADRQVSYMQEARRAGDELRAQGDLADNQRIRETSAESDAHADANRERDTAIANQNITELNKADAAKHQLTAQKYSADWTNMDQYLLGWQAKLQKDQNKQKELEQQLALLNTKENLLGNIKLREYREEVDDLFDKYYNEKDPTKKAQLKKQYEEASQKYQLYNIQVQRENLRSIYAKSGTKITKKDTSDKYLYRTSRDIVDHFRKMSKMTDDSRVKTLPKAAKLTSHPKKKLQLGGVAPFTVYRPLGVGGETTTQTSTSTEGTKSSKDTAAKDKLDMIKELFKQVQGLPIDVSKVYQEISMTLNRAKALGEELSTDDIASMYLNSMNRMAQLKYSSEAYKQAHTQAVANEALNEIAVGSQGELILQNRETGEIKRGTFTQLQESEGKLNALTNSQLLEMRAKSPNLAFDDDIFNIVNNGIGISKIAKEIKSLASSLGASEKKLEGVSEVQNRKIKAGLQVLSGFDGTPDGFYKISQNTKDSKDNVKMALNYIYNMLPTNYKVIMKMHSGSEENSKALIAQYLSSQVSSSYEESITPLTGKASDKDKENDLDKLGINSATQLLLGMSSPREFTFNIGNGNSFTGVARVSSITKDGNPFGADFTYSEIYKSDLHKNLDLDNASFGDVPINKSLKDRIVIDNSTIAGVDLPYTIDRNGRIIPDFQMLNRIEEADQEILRSGIDPNKDPQKVNEIYAKHKLPIKYGADNKLTGNYKRFAVVQATAIEDVFLNKDGLASNGTLTLVSDENEINKYLNELKKATGEKEIDMDRPGLFTGDKDIYKGSIFIPIIGDLVDAVSSTGGLKAGNYDELRSKYQTRNYNEAPQFVKQ